MRQQKYKMPRRDFRINKLVPAIKKTMLVFSVMSFSLLLMSAGWRTDFDRAKEEAKESKKQILLSFSGSDWCIPCIKTRKEIFEKESFIKFAETSLVLVNADFPRLKKNSLSTEQTKQNEALAERYNKDGIFPFTLLLNANGTVLKEWRGFPDMTPEIFVSQIKDFEHTN